MKTIVLIPAHGKVFHTHASVRKFFFANGDFKIAGLYEQDGTMRVSVGTCASLSSLLKYSDYTHAEIRTAHLEDCVLIEFRKNDAQD